jgi:UDP-N-acetylglucosamine--N-acetylmuramyl-(pentapeptide) pyrophosphoryl-undecaprenol N-acetylglucosamine transferase
MSKSILLVGGGSGGHLTPLLAVAEALKRQDNSLIVVHIGQKGEALDDVLSNSAVDNHFAITAGKFRRYHGESLVSHLLDIKTLLLNVRDLFRFIIGTIHAWFLLGKIKPSSILLKGGFVCVPVGLAARLRHIPYITHDSDAVPGLANKITSKHAVYNTTAMPSEIYPYDQAKTIQVGIPLRSEFKRVSEADRDNSKKGLGLGVSTKVLLSVGGGLGAQKVNNAVVKASKKLLANNDLFIIHLTGKKLFNETQIAYEVQLNQEEQSSIKLIDFTTEIAKYSAAADVIITRGGATNIAEFAQQAKACIVIPNPVLTGGQQIHNAKVLADNNAAIIVDETELDTLSSRVQELLDSTETARKNLGLKLHNLAVSDGDEKLATLLIEIAQSRVE